MAQEPRIPDSDTNWQAIDIFVFSNGQQYSPPRKYHLRTEDLNLWKSTLHSVAKTQYGSSISSIELYSLEGRKLEGPLELHNGAFYVAVAPQDVFVNAGYEKYLIRASRSWEKRQARKAEDVIDPVADDNKTVNETGQNDVKLEVPGITTQDSTLLKTIVSNMENPNTSEIIKPQPISVFQEKYDPPPTSTAKPKSSIQRPSIIRKVTPPSLPAPSVKPSFKRRDSLKSANVKINRLECARRSSLACDSSQDNKPLVKSRMNQPTTRPKGFPLRPEAVLPKGKEVTTDLKASPIKGINVDDRKLSTNSNDLKNIINDKEFVVISNLYINPQRELPSVSLNPILTLHEPIRQTATTAIIDNNVGEIVQEDVNINSKTKINVPTSNTLTTVSQIEKYTNPNDELKSSAHESIITEKFLIESIHTITHNFEHNAYLGNETKTMTTENMSIHDSPLQSDAVTHEKPDNQYEYKSVSEKAEINLNNEVILSAHRSNETIKFQNSPPNDIEKTCGLALTATNKPLNGHYVAFLNTGDVVNLKLRIEIENRNGRNKHNDNTTKSHSATNMHTEKGSQINIDDEIIAQNKSLLSLIAKEVKGRHMGDNNHVIIIQSSGCKYCNEKKILDKEANKNSIIILPIEKIEETTKRQTPTNVILQSSLHNPVKLTSCTCQEKMAQPNKLSFAVETRNENVCANENVMKNVSVSRKNSVVINKETIQNAEEPSKISIISEQINVKTQLLAVSKESVAIQPKTKDDIHTQTEWCDTLLEARRLEDGHYTFRLPPLELLKYYKLT